MTINRFLFYLCGDRTKASSRVRGYWIAESLEEKGVQSFMEHRHSKLALLLFFFRIPFYDVIFFQKTYSRYHCWLLQWARVLGKVTILDLDDAPSRNNSPITLKNVQSMMGKVTAVIVGSQALLEYCQKYSNNVHLIPSSIYLKYYQPPTKKINSDKLICLGWIGNGKHYKEDLITLLKEPLTVIAKHYPIRFKLIGACGQKELHEAFTNIPGLKVELIDQIDWSNPQAVTKELEDIDIGLYPLLPNNFNKYKCGFKALEYMAMQIPVISSDIAENKEIIDHGITGLFASSPQEWIKQIEFLLTDEPARRKMGDKGRDKVEKEYSINCNCQKILDNSSC